MSEREVDFQAFEKEIDEHIKETCQHSVQQTNKWLANFALTSTGMVSGVSINVLTEPSLLKVSVTLALGAGSLGSLSRFIESDKQHYDAIVAKNDVNKFRQLG